MGDMAPFHKFQKFAERSVQGVARKSATRALNRSSRREGFARVTQNMFPPLTEIWDPAIGLMLTLVQRSGLRSTRRGGGWTALPQTVFQQIGLADRRRRGEAVQRLVGRGVLETRTSSKGAALEYRLRPVAQWGGAQP
jgi:hypothetical protein